MWPFGRKRTEEEIKFAKSLEFVKFEVNIIKKRIGARTSQRELMDVHASLIPARDALQEIEKYKSEENLKNNTRNFLNKFLLFFSFIRGNKYPFLETFIKTSYIL